MEPSSSQSGGISPHDIRTDHSSVVASSSDSTELAAKVIPESNFHDSDSEDMSYDYSCPAPSTEFQPIHADMPEMPGSSSVSEQPSSVPESSLIMEQYNLPSENSLSPQSTTMLHPAMNLSIQPSSSCDTSIRDVRLPIQGHNILEMVGSTSDTDMDDEIDSSRQLSWHGQGPEVNEASTSQDSHGPTDMVSYSLPDQHVQGHYDGAVYHENGYGFNVTSTEGLVYSSVRFHPQATHYPQVHSYGDISSLADSYHHNAQSSSDIQIYSHGEATVESSSENQIVSTNEINQPTSTEPDSAYCVKSPTQQLDSTTDDHHTMAIDSTADINNDMTDVAIGSSTKVTSQVEQCHISIPVEHESIDEQSRILAEAGHSSTSSGLQYSTMQSVIAMDNYPTTTGQQLNLTAINPAFCQIDDDNQSKVLQNLIQQQAFVNAMFQPSRQFDPPHLEMTEAERRQLLIGSSLHQVTSSTSAEIDHGQVNKIPPSPQFQDEASQNEIEADDEIDVEKMDMSGESLDLSVSNRLQQKEADTLDANQEESCSSYWCEECNMAYTEQCPEHRVQTICDKPVLTRAWASLPATYLSINMVDENEDGAPVYGVFAKKSIPKRTQFGPVEGILVKREMLTDFKIALYIEDENNEPLALDTSNEMLSNWMRFIRVADDFSEMNLMVIQQGQFIYFNTTKSVNAKSELKVNYSPNYAAKYELEHFSYPIQLQSDANEKTEWPCFECDEKFMHYSDLHVHLNQHSSNEGSTPSPKKRKKKSKLKKVISNKAVNGASSGAENTNEAESVQSVASDKKEDQYECNVCSKKFQYSYSLQRHQIMHSGEKKYKCPICDMKFCHVYNRNRHIQKHKIVSDNAQKSTSISLFKRKQSGGSEWLCTHCNLTFDNSSLLNLHTLTHAAENVSMSDDVSTSDSSYVSANLQTVQEAPKEAPLKCPQCTKEFFVKKDLIEHASVHGKLIQRKQSQNSKTNQFKCQTCHKSFLTAEKLQRHELVHGSDDLKPFQCDMCQRRFMKNSALARHMKTHSGEKITYPCPICKEVFEIITHLRDHVPIHCVDGIYSCPSCPKKFEEFHLLRNHIRISHSTKTYECDQCDKVFRRIDKLKLHMLKHSDHWEFLCANCGKQFKRKDKLKEHMKRMHSGERDKKPRSKPKNLGCKVLPSNYHRFIYKCHECLLGFKRRGMLVNHLAKRHPDVRPDSVPELNLPILKTTIEYFCQYCNKVYKSNSKRKVHILKNHPGAELPLGSRQKKQVTEGAENSTFSQPIGSVTTYPMHCDWCYKQYATKSKLHQHQRLKHPEMLEASFLAKQAAGQEKASTSEDQNVTTLTAAKNPNSDILIQAMTELTQRLSEFRNVNGANTELQLVTNTTNGNTGIVGLKVITYNADGNSIAQEIGTCIDPQMLENGQIVTDQGELLKQLLSRQFVQCTISEGQTASIEGQQQILLDENGLMSATSATLAQLAPDHTFVTQNKDAVVTELHPDNLTLTLNPNNPEDPLALHSNDQTVLISTSGANSDAVIHAEVVKEVPPMNPEHIEDGAWSTVATFSNYVAQ